MNDPLLSSFFDDMKKAGLSSDERRSARRTLQRFVGQRASRANEVQRSLDRLASTLPASGLSLEEKRRISAAVYSFMDAMPLASAQSGGTPPLFFGAWQGGNLLKVVRPFSLASSVSSVHA